MLATNERIAWVQLPYAGIEPFVHLVQDDRTWTCGKGIFAEPVAELALTPGARRPARAGHLRQVDNVAG